MKRISPLRTAAIFLYALLCVAAPGISAQTPHPAASAPAAALVPAPSTPLPANAFAGFPAGAARRIDLDVEEDATRNVSRRERTDQLRDWLLMTVISDSGLPAEAINGILYDMPAVRRGYLQPVANFEYGETRSRMVADGQLVSLVPADLSAEARVDALAHIADEHRKDSGETPSALIVFEYRIEPDGQTASVTRRETLNARQLFTPEAGYFESRIAALADLERFLGQVDDITYASTAGGLTLGGRKIKGRQYLGVKVEDVTAIWVSERNIQTRLKAHEAREKSFSETWRLAFGVINNLARDRIAAANRDLNQLRALVPVNPLLGTVEDFTSGLFKWKHASQVVREINKVVDAHNRDDVATFNRLGREISRLQAQQREELNSKNDAESRQGTLADASGFSLDPTYDFKELGAALADNESSLRAQAQRPGAAITAADIQKAKQGIADKDAIPFLVLADKLKKNANANSSSIGESLSDAAETHRLQAARYNGDLQGTEVGMTLFYTDLLAKLWALDYSSSTPRHIEDFKAYIHIPISVVFREELLKVNRSRLWFGQSARGMQVADQGSALMLGRNATRLFAKSRNELERGEGESNAAMSSFINWWDRHYEEIARYEPQYERLNEIMKWSLVVGWLNNAGQADRLGFLSDIEVKHDNWFPEWARRHAELKFNKWEDVPFFPKGHRGTQTETLPPLSSVRFEQGGVEGELSGGVSLAGKKVFEARRVLSPGAVANRLIRRPNLESVTTVAGRQSIKTFEGPTHTLRPEGPGRASLVSSPKAQVNLREASTGALNANSQFERAIAQRPQGLRVETRVGGTELGSLDIAKTENGFSLGWRSRDLDAGTHLARRMSRHSRPESLLASDPNVNAAYSLPGGQYLVKMRGSGKWMKLAPEGAGGAAGWQARVAGSKADARTFKLGWVNEQQAIAEARAGQVIRQAPPRPTAGEPVPPAELARVNKFISDGEFVKAGNHVDELLVAYGESPELNFRKALALLHRGRVQEADALFTQSIGRSLRDGDAFYQEVNRRLNLAAGAPGESLFYAADEAGGAALNYRLPALGEAEGVTAAQLARAELKGASVYVQDTPGLNNIDWNASTVEVLRQVVARDLGEVVRLPRGDIARYRPGRIVTTEATFKMPPRPAAASQVRPSGRLYPMPGDDDDDDEDEEEDGYIYLIRAKRP